MSALSSFADIRNRRVDGSNGSDNCRPHRAVVGHEQIFDYDAGVTDNPQNRDIDVAPIHAVGYNIRND